MLERVYDGELVESPWQYTEGGTPVFVSNSYEEHVQEWINKEEEGKKVLWEMSAIAASFTGRHQGRDGDKAIQSFAKDVGVGRARIYQLVEAYKLRSSLEEVSTQVDTLANSLTLKHFYVVAHFVIGRGGRLV
jgi:hypothetical protein